MSHVELAHELGTPGKAVVEAFDRYNGLLDQDPAALAHTLGRVAAGKRLTDQSERQLAQVATDVLDVTNDGARIGIDHASREATWAKIFEDPDHNAAQSEYGKRTTEANRIRYELEQLRRLIDSMAETEQSDKLDIALERQQVLEERAKQLAEELTALRRLRGMHALRVVALLNAA